jgi:hypothetical protein
MLFGSKVLYLKLVSVFEWRYSLFPSHCIRLAQWKQRLNCSTITDEGPILVYLEIKPRFRNAKHRIRDIGRERATAVEVRTSISACVGQRGWAGSVPWWPQRRSGSPPLATGNIHLKNAVRRRHELQKYYKRVLLQQAVCVVAISLRQSVRIVKPSRKVACLLANTGRPVKLAGQEHRLLNRITIWNSAFPLCLAPHRFRVSPSSEFRSLTNRFCFSDRLCGLVVRVPGYRSRDPGSSLGTTRFSESSGSGTGPTQPREYNWGDAWKKK